MKSLCLLLVLAPTLISAFAQDATHSRGDASNISASQTTASMHSENIPKQSCSSWLGELYSKGDLERTSPEQLLQYMQRLGDCILHDGTLTSEDWKNAVLLNGDLNSSFWKKMGNSNMNAALQVGLDASRECVRDYNKLVTKYNDLVDLAQRQHELLRLSTAQPSLPTLPTHVHCIALKTGILTTIDCD